MRAIVVVTQEMKPVEDTVKGLSGNGILMSKLLAECFSEGAGVLLDGYSLSRGRHER